MRPDREEGLSQRAARLHAIGQRLQLIDREVTGCAAAKVYSFNRFALQIVFLHFQLQRLQQGFKEESV